jgi:hypothetical protein
MTITIGTQTDATPAANATSPQTWTHSTDANTDMVVVAVTIYDVSATDGVVSAVTYDGKTLTSRFVEYDATCDGHISVWERANSDIQSITNGVVSVTFGGVVTDFMATILNVESSTGSFVYDSVDTKTASNGSPLIAFGCGLNDQSKTGTIAITVGSSLYIEDVGADNVFAGYNIYAGGTSTPTLTWTESDTDEDFIVSGCAYVETSVTSVTLDTAALTASGVANSINVPVTVECNTAYIGIAEPAKRVTFETGDTSEFDSISDPDSDLAVNTSAAMTGHYGLEVTIDDTTAVYGQIDYESSESIYAKFKIDPNTLTMGDGESFIAFRIRQDGDSFLSPARVWLGYTTAGGYRLTFEVKDDADVEQAWDNENITDASHTVEVLVVKATNAASSDGYFEWWIDGVSKGSWASVDNFNTFDNVAGVSGLYSQAGVIYIVDTISGTFYIDDIFIAVDGLDVTREFVVGLNTASITTTGPQITIDVPAGSQTVTMGTASITTAGVTSDVDAPISRTMVTGATSVSGVAFQINQTVKVSTASITASGVSNTIISHSLVDVNTGAITTTGAALSIDAPISREMSTGAVTVSGVPLSVNAPITIECNTAAITLRLMQVPPL